VGVQGGEDVEEGGVEGGKGAWGGHGWSGGGGVRLERAGGGVAVVVAMVEG